MVLEFSQYETLRATDEVNWWAIIGSTGRVGDIRAPFGGVLHTLLTLHERRRNTVLRPIGERKVTRRRLRRPASAGEDKMSLTPNAEAPRTINIFQEVPRRKSNEERPYYARISV